MAINLTDPERELIASALVVARRCLNTGNKPRKDELEMIAVAFLTLVNVGIIAESDPDGST